MSTLFFGGINEREAALARQRATIATVEARENFDKQQRIYNRTEADMKDKSTNDFVSEPKRAKT